MCIECSILQSFLSCHDMIGPFVGARQPCIAFVRKRMSTIMSSRKMEMKLGKNMGLRAVDRSRKEDHLSGLVNSIKQNVETK